MTDAETQQHDQSQHASSTADRAINAAEPMIVFAFARLRDEYATLAGHRPREGELPSPDAVHRTRIAARRLRVALKLFKDMLPRDEAAALAGGLRWFARSLGEVRDLDVYAEQLRTHVTATSGVDSLVDYQRHVEQARDTARASLPALFGDPRYEALLRAFGKFLAGSPTPGALRRWRSFLVSEGAPAYVETSIKRILKRGNRIGAASEAQELHRLRITAKRLRYELEFFAEVYPSLRRSARAVKRLQDVLGEHQDACAATRRIAEYAEVAGGSDTLTALAQTHRLQAADAQSRFSTEWRRFKKTISFSELRELLAA